MTKTLVFLFALAMASALAAWAEDHVPSGPETVVVQSGTLKLRALLWHPGGHGPFPAVLFNHGSGNTPENQAAQAAAVGPRLRQTCHVLLFVYRRGDAPEVDIDFINEPDPHMPNLGARGIGEIGVVGAPAAVANAVFNATGKRVRDLPITPDKLI
jgi:hypothetical protein